MDILTSAERARITREIAAAEEKTSGEIIAVVTQSSDDYLFIPLLWAALLALLVPLVMFAFTGWEAAYIYALQLAVFAAGSLAVQWRPLRIALVPRKVKRARAHRHAMEQVLAQNLHTTKARTGVLIFVSEAERFVEIIADDGIFEKAPRGVWDEAVARLGADIAEGKLAQGIVTAVAQCGGVLAEHFPPGGADENELPNHLIVLE